mmetsp:Transcript_34838/g.108748  ORF Transcript_34838/g.108748 Transcript_34838/m.108748 type:complete len:328 (+) Transcript_34838:1086-2069(+)
MAGFFDQTLKLATEKVQVAVQDLVLVEPLVGDLSHLGLHLGSDGRAHQVSVNALHGLQERQAQGCGHQEAAALARLLLRPGLGGRAEGLAKLVHDGDVVAVADGRHVRRHGRVRADAMLVHQADQLMLLHERRRGRHRLGQVDPVEAQAGAAGQGRVVRLWSLRSKIAQNPWHGPAKARLVDDDLGVLEVAAAPLHRDLAHDAPIAEGLGQAAQEVPGDELVDPPLQATAQVLPSCGPDGCDWRVVSHVTAHGWRAPATPQLPQLPLRRVAPSRVASMAFQHLCNIEALRILGGLCARVADEAAAVELLCNLHRLLWRHAHRLAAGL